MNEELIDPYTYYELYNQWWRVTAHVSNCTIGDTVNWIYFETSPDASGTVTQHPWYFYTSDIKSLTSSGEGGARLAYDGGSLGWWGTTGSPDRGPVITFAPLTQSTGLAEIQTMTNHDFIRYIVDGSDYRSRYNISSGGSGTVISPTSWSNGSGTYTASTRTAVISTPSTNGSSWSCIVWTATEDSQGHLITNWIYPPGATGASDAPSRYGTMPNLFSVQIPDEAYGLLRVRWYYTLDGSSTQQTQTVTLVQDLEPNSLQPGASTTAPYFGDVSVEVDIHGKYVIFADVHYADSVSLYYSTDLQTWSLVRELGFDSSRNQYWFNGFLPVSGAYYKLVATATGQTDVDYDLGIKNSITQFAFTEYASQLVEWVSALLAVIPDMFLWMPVEIRTVLISAIVIMIVLGLIGWLKG